MVRGYINGVFMLKFLYENILYTYKKGVEIVKKINVVY